MVKELAQKLQELNYLDPLQMETWQIDSCGAFVHAAFSHLSPMLKLTGNDANL